MAHLCQSYNEKALIRKYRKETVKLHTRNVAKLSRKIDFYAIAISGTSGILGAMVAYELDLELITVRGKGVNAHSSHLAEGNFYKGGYLFFDDLIDSGATLYRVHTAIQDEVTKVNLWETWQATQMVECPHLAGVYLHDSSPRMNPGLSQISIEDHQKMQLPQFTIYTKYDFQTR